MNAMRVLCTNTYLLQQNINKIISDGGEGVILRKCKSKYVCGRSDLLWKLKVPIPPLALPLYSLSLPLLYLYIFLQTQREDTEALVVHEEEDSTFILQLYHSSPRPLLLLSSSFVSLGLSSTFVNFFPGLMG